jgi:3,4-dihydroxy 2-butanone 4-phosphate synthase/GTP cyclohydrolase II
MSIAAAMQAVPPLQGFAPVPELIAEIAAGRMVILLDDGDREDEGDLIIAGDKITPEAINFMVTHGRGLVCLAMAPDLVDKLELPLQQGSGDNQRTAFTLSIDAREGLRTGISAAERALTVKVAIAPDASPKDIVTPGHMFPLKARAGGVIDRPGHTEAAVDLARLAGLTPAGVICEIMNEDGTMARAADLLAFATRHGLKVGLIADLVTYIKTT